jgi:hypothetical protein
MKMLILAVLLSFAFGSAAYKYQPDPKQHKYYINQHPHEASFLVTNPAGDSNQQGTDSELCQRLLDALVVNWPLVLVGIFGILVALRALKPTRTAADAAKESANAIVSAERAVLFTSLDWIPGYCRLFYDREGIGATSASVRLCCINAGRTPGQILEGRAGMMILDALPKALDFSNAKERLAAKGPIRVGDSKLWEVTVQCDGIADPTHFTVIFGVIPYLDIFGKQREATFGFEAQGSTIRQITEQPYNKNS